MTRYDTVTDITVTDPQSLLNKVISKIDINITTNSTAFSFNPQRLASNAPTTAPSQQLSIATSSDAQNVYDNYNISLQVIIVSYQVTCVLRAAIDALFLYGIPQPKLIRLIVPSIELTQCNDIQTTSKNVLCYSEYDLLPLNQSKIKQWFESKGWNTEGFGRRFGWYLQQLLKLQAVQFWSSELGEYFLIWDADMVLIKDYTFFLNNLMRINSGGDRIWSRNYKESTATLTGLKYEDEYSWICNDCITHQMLVKKSIMMEILNKIADGNQTLTGVSFAKKLIDKIPTNVKYPQAALSEYSIYYEYVLFYYPKLFQKDHIHRFKR